ncbi:hypothetical protein A3H03_00705 [Candidatus Kuenenbacteria bacterium RIFCSPLOWO2_12_FULL_42_13]|uniref:Kinase inhibitor n=1 Tax=Candidatus Kuenenbacteria bacterium RIFCSPLOWO2_12_FULL_42_13 TaxID=1798565 RepID=A0A1F6G1H6_9BACT|nr:MAG: hypothetical protein A3H03_00705 [Candidatus Kuenenbacteria bacterium RIFCSPLOWO2_12_FULL_42_13]
MQLTSQDFQNNDFIPDKFTCRGEDVNPNLEISAVPAEAKSLALIVDDPDAPAGDWVHWLVWNIAPKTKTITADSVPEGASQGTADFGKPGWGGPCPPSGTHRYFFKLYALDSMLDLRASNRKKDLEAAMQGHIAAKTELVGLVEVKR